MGVVDLAVDDAGRVVAVKRVELHGSVHDMARARLRLRREAEALGRVRHPNVMPLLDLVDEADEVVLVMPYLSGGTLADQVREHGRLTPGQVLAIAGPLLEGLAAAHRQGIVHRDLKPANILFDADGRPYLTDFGIATLRDTTPGLTATGMIMGTPEFMAPEQARGEQADAACDVFALGATLLYALTGSGPWGRGDPRALLLRASQGRTVRLPADLPPALDRLLVAMLARNPDRRPTAAALVGGPAGTALLTPPRRRWPAIAVAAAAVVVLAGAATAVATWPDDTTTDGDRAAAEPVDTTAPSTVPCTPLPYQACGEPVAPFTDGTDCTAEHADYDGDRTNGCEAEPDDLDGSLPDDTLEANLVPLDDIDRYPLAVEDDFHFSCDGTVTIRLTAPAGASMRLDVLEGGAILASTTSTDGVGSTVSLTEPECLGDDSTELQLRVSWAGEARTADTYRLEIAGSY
jgi:hypothetical protein